ncbi:MAG: hypothetical protein AAB316_06785, partial [Bacteroidota bacterium]
MVCILLSASAAFPQSNLGIGTTSPENRLHVVASDANHAALIQNTEALGDGLKIRLQGIHPLWNGLGYNEVFFFKPNYFDPLIEAIKDMVEGETQPPVNPLSFLNVNGFQFDQLAQYGACWVSNNTFAKLNDTNFGFSVDIDPELFQIPGFSWDAPAVSYDPPGVQWNPPAVQWDPPLVAWDPPAVEWNPPAF